VPWRFSDAGRMSAWRARLAGVRKPAHNLHISGHSRTATEVHLAISALPCSFRPLQEPEHHSCVFCRAGHRCRRYEATWFEVSRARHAQYEHAYHVKFKPKKARYPRKFVDYRGHTVIVDGWGHPEFDPLALLRKVEATTVTVATDSASDPHKLKLAGYLASLPISQILGPRPLE